MTNTKKTKPYKISMRLTTEAIRKINNLQRQKQKEDKEAFISLSSIIENLILSN